MIAGVAGDETFQPEPAPVRYPQTATPAPAAAAGTLAEGADLGLGRRDASPGPTKDDADSCLLHESASYTHGTEAGFLRLAGCLRNRERSVERWLLRSPILLHPNSSPCAPALFVLARRAVTAALRSLAIESHRRWPDDTKPAGGGVSLSPPPGTLRGEAPSTRGRSPNDGWLPRRSGVPNSLWLGFALAS